MRPPRQPRTPRPLGEPAPRSGGGQPHSFALPQDEAATAALSPSEAEAIADPRNFATHVDDESHAPVRGNQGERFPRSRAAASPVQQDVSASADHREEGVGEVGRSGGHRDGASSVLSRIRRPLSLLSAGRGKIEEVSGDTPLPSERAEKAVTSRDADELEPARLYESWRREIRDETQPSDLEQRRRERRAERRRIWMKRGGYTAASVGLVVCLVWVFLFSPIFGLSLDRVRVEGTEGSQLAPETVTGIVAGNEGTSVLRINTGAVEDELRSAIPLIKSVDVSRDLPKGLTVALTLRTPVACLIVDGACSPVDEDGVQLGIQAEALPQLEINAGQEVSGAEVTSMLHVLGAVDADTRALVASVKVDENLQVRLNLTSGAEVLWGDATDLDTKARVLKVLLSQPASYYDVSAPNHPISQ
ncbi:FtsQ-type POTRA domain-containing protein [Arcanobacterium haemolyticum]|nr:FtsQ-type POTRA domain-containing protein [Arcanobacterium haemolyticum]